MKSIPTALVIHLEFEPLASMAAGAIAYRRHRGPVPLFRVSSSPSGLPLCRLLIPWLLGAAGVSTAVGVPRMKGGVREPGYVDATIPAQLQIAFPRIVNSSST